VIRTTTNPLDNEGDELDVERGDASPTDAPNWVARRRAAGHGGPLVYCSLSSWATVQEAFRRARISEPEYRIASYDGKAVVPAGAIGKQYDMVTTGGHNYDVSIVVDYLPGIDPFPLPPLPIEEDTIMELVVDANGTAHIVGVGIGARAGHPLYITVTSGDVSVTDITDAVAAKTNGDRCDVVQEVERDNPLPIGWTRVRFWTIGSATPESLADLCPPCLAAVDQVVSTPPTGPAPAPA
jgi:hypothetical protein